MSVEQTDVIDFASVNDAGQVVLTISDHLEWDGVNSHLLLLQEKVNAYIACIQSGELLEVYPDSAGRSQLISIKAMHEPDRDGFELLSAIKRTLEGASIAFSFEHTLQRQDDR